MIEETPQLEDFCPPELACEQAVSDGYLLYEPNGPEGAWIESDAAIRADEVL